MFEYETVLTKDYGFQTHLVFEVDSGTLQERAHELVGVPRHRIRPTIVQYITALSTVLHLFHVRLNDSNSIVLQYLKIVDKLQIFTFAHMLNIPIYSPMYVLYGFEPVTFS